MVEGIGDLEGVGIGTTRVCGFWTLLSTILEGWTGTHWSRDVELQAFERNGLLPARST